MKIFKYALLLTLTLSLFSSCKDDDDDDAPAKKQILRIFVDGELQQGSSIFTVSNDREEYNETNRTFNLYADLEDYEFGLTISNWSWQGLPNKGPKVKTYFPSDDMKRECQMDDDFNLMCESATISYFRTRDTFYLTRLYDYEENQVGITRNSDNTIDGYFDVVCITSRNDTVHLEGSFNDIEID
jgi:hypothetical protein